MKTSIAGIGVGSGLKDSFYFSVLEFYENEKRWFLKTCQQLKEFDYPKTEDSLLAWITDFNLNSIIVDFPLSYPPCFDCHLECPGSTLCGVKEVKRQRKKIDEILSLDEKLYQENPKKYEVLRKKADSSILSKSLKRKLKKGFIPYWNRSSDLEIHLKYHDLLMKYFKRGFRSLGSSNSNQMLRFKYLEKHFPKKLKVYESDHALNLIEMYQNKIILEKDLRNLNAFQSSVIARKDIIKKIEKRLSIFIYDKDRETLIEKPRAFQSFILALTGIEVLNKKLKNKSFFVSELSYL